MLIDAGDTARSRTNTFGRDRCSGDLGKAGARDWHVCAPAPVAHIQGHPTHTPRTAAVDPNGSAPLPLSTDPAPLSQHPLSDRRATVDAPDKANHKTGVARLTKTA